MSRSLSTPSDRCRSILLVLLLIGTLTSVTRAQPVGAGGQTEADARESERQRRQRELEDARTKQLVERFAASSKETVELLSRLESSAAAYQARLEGLLTNDDGKRIAQDPVAFMGFIRLQEQPIVSIEQVRVRKRNAQTLLEALSQELKRPTVGWLPDDVQRRENDGLFFWAKERLNQIEEQQAWLTTTLAKLPKDANLPAAKTLDAVLREYKSRQMELWARARVEGEAAATEESHRMVSESARVAELDRARAEAERLLKEARAEISAMKTQFDIQQKARDADLRKQMLEAEMKHRDEIARLERDLKVAQAKRDAADVRADIEKNQIQADAEKQKRLEKCRTPEVRNVLAPFLADGYWQPGDKNGAKGIDKTPVSLSKLRSYGALTPDTKGLQKLLECGTNRYHYGKADTVRPRWSYDPRLNKNTPEAIEELKRAQAFLNELGETMVELKMLAP